MALIKNSNLRVSDAEVVIGANGVTRPPEDFEEATAIVPQADPGAGYEPYGEYDENGQPLDGQFDDLGLGGDFDDLFATPGELTSEVPQDTGPTWDEPMAEFDRAREQALFAANDASDLDANAYGEQVQNAAGELMTSALERVAVELEEANPAGDFGKVMPYVQRRVAVELDLELVGTVSEIRWTHLKAFEAEIVEGAETLAQQVRAGSALAPESFEALMAHREAILSDARLEAERLMMEAMTRSAETMAQAEQAQASTMLELEKEKDRILAELREAAYQDGYNEGKQDGEQQAAQYVTEALTKLNEIAVAFPAAVKKNEEKLVTLALEIAKKIIQDEIAIQPELVQRTVETSLKRVSDLEMVVVKVNPLDLDLILPKQETFKQIVPDVQNFSIEGSHTIPRGGCVIETNSGSINATLSTQLSIIEEMFRNVRAEYEEEVLGELS